MTILLFSIQYVQKTISKVKISNFIWMENPLVIHQEGVKAAYTRDHGTESIRLISPLKTEKNMASTGIEPATFALLARRSNQLS